MWRPLSACKAPFDDLVRLDHDRRLQKICEAVVFLPSRIARLAGVFLFQLNTSLSGRFAFGSIQLMVATECVTVRAGRS